MWPPRKSHRQPSSWRRLMLVIVILSSSRRCSGPRLQISDRLLDSSKTIVSVVERIWLWFLGSMVTCSLPWLHWSHGSPRISSSRMPVFSTQTNPSSFLILTLIESASMGDTASLGIRIEKMLRWSRSGKKSKIFEDISSLAWSELLMPETIIWNYISSETLLYHLSRMRIASTAERSKAKRDAALSFLITLTPSEN